MIPDVNNHKIQREWTGIMNFSSDGNFLVGKIDCLPGNVHVIAGWDSGGIMNAPGAAKLLA